MRAIAALLATLLSFAAHAETPTHGITILGTPALPADFPFFPYVNPDAPKGGEVTLSAVGTFDSFNPFILRGTAPLGVNRVWESLLRDSADEIATGYGAIAETVEVAADRLSVAFTLRPQARFHDGTPITAEDVVWTFETLREKGRPFYRQFYADVAAVVAVGPSRVVFRFKNNQNRELPLVLGEMPILPKHWWASRDFTKPLTEPPLGSGPYRVDRFEFGRSLAFRRVADWWGRDLPVNRGMYNFDTIRTEFFRDATVALEAFKVGQIDFRSENIAKQWATAYDFPAVQRGLVRKEELRNRLPTGMQGFVMNTRRAIFKDARVRQALAVAFDFEWANKNIFYGAYVRTQSYFANSALETTGLPQGAELDLLDRYRAQLPPEIFTQEFRLPVTDGSGNNREELRTAFALLKDAGWQVKDRKLVDAGGKPFSFEILLAEPAFERVALPYVQTLNRLGIEARVRTVDPAQYQRLTDIYDFDMTVTVFASGDLPGNELATYWTCASVQPEGGDNLAGVCSPVIDALVNQVITATNRDDLAAAAHALDHILQWGWYMVPHWHTRVTRAAWWDRFARPDKPIRPGLVLDTWWLDAAHAAATDAARRGK